MLASLLTLLRVGFAALALYAMGTQLLIHLRGGFSAINFFSYFTNLSNLLAALVLLACASGRFVGARGTLSGERIRTIALANMIIVGVVFAVLLRDVDLGALLPWINTVLHTVMPIVVVLDWLVDPPRQRLSTRDLLSCLILPALYLGYTLLRGAATGIRSSIPSTAAALPPSPATRSASASCSPPSALRWRGSATAASIGQARPDVDAAAVRAPCCIATARRKPHDRQAISIRTSQCVPPTCLPSSCFPASPITAASPRRRVNWKSAHRRCRRRSAASNNAWA